VSELSNDHPYTDDQRKRDRARRLAAALTEYADDMHRASLADRAGDTYSAHANRAAAAHALARYPELSALIDRMGD
jgi:hypothetical protein